jgi:hypothetical protein
VLPILRSTVFALLAAHIAVSEMAAQWPAPVSDYRAAFAQLQARDTVRIRSMHPQLGEGEAVIARLGADTIVVTTRPGFIGRSESIDLPGSLIHEIDRMERQRRSGGRKIGFTLARGLIGAAVGTAIGAGIGSMSKDNDESSEDERALTSAIFGAAGFVVGGSVGIVYGAIRAGKPRVVWRPILRSERAR